MSVIVSLLLLALGAILYLAAGLHAVGLVLMIGGGLATVLSVLQLALMTRRGRRPPAEPM
jgi:ABC-type sulfate transport system permease component